MAEDPKSVADDISEFYEQLRSGGIPTKLAEQLTVVFLTATVAPKPEPPQKGGATDEG